MIKNGVPMKRWTCPKCKCRKEQTAEDRCQPVRDYSDEYSCPADGVEADQEGNFIVPANYKSRIPEEIA